MARQRPMRAHQVEIDGIVIRLVQYQLEVNRCRNEEIIVKGNFGWMCPIWAGRHRVGNGAMHINRCRNEEVKVKGNFGWVWPMWVGCPRVGNGAMHKFPNEEIIVKDNFGWVWSMWAGRPIRIYRTVIRKVQYQFEVNQCRNEELIVKANFAWVWPMLVWRPRVGNGAMHIEIDRLVIREYQFEVNQCRNKEIIVKDNFGWVRSMWAGAPGLIMGPCIVEIDRIVKFQIFQGPSAYSVGGDNGQDGQTDRRTDGEITQYLHAFQKAWG
ncbi:hypothetical protein DPMN_061422 [Dreissena polymorpha]|uniref:Uncharacterized protein n=1 Tax=Dreissena polymorpha TaxID=45954 RepID=A0A9D4C6Z7_DREPO|nr:hypothetical protein DPMN_061422 [Dreissena polymorpha]